jgi:hypothetical protein
MEFSLDRVGADADHVDRRMRLLQRLGDDPDLGNGEVAALEGEPLLRPRPDHDLQRLLEALAALDLGDAIALELDGPVASPDAHVQPPAAQDVHHRQLLGEADRVVEGQDGRGEPDADVARAHGRGGGQHRRRDRQAVLDEVVLGQPDAVEPQLLGPGHLVHLVAHDVRMGESGRGLQEVVGSEPHGSAVTVPHPGTLGVC